MNFSDLIKEIDLSKVDPEFYQSTTHDFFNNVNEENYRTFLKEALVQINIIFKFENLHGFFIADWRINFSNLNGFIETKYKNIPCDSMIEEFLNIHSQDSTEVLYKRLDLEY